MIFCQSGDTISGFVGIWNGTEVCWFDMLAIIMGTCIIAGIILTIYFSRKEKNKLNPVKEFKDVTK